MEAKLINQAYDELSYGLNTNIQKEIKAYYIKDINGKGLDINFYLKYEIDTSYYNYFIINGYSLPFDYIKYIDKDYLLKISANNDYEGFKSIFDPKVKSGLIIFDEYKDEIYKKDNYFLFFYHFAEKGSIPFDYDISSEIFVESKDSKKILVKDKYIRGYFDLLKNDTIQNNTYYIQIQKDEAKNNQTYLLEFSCNFKDVKVIFDNFSCDDNRTNWGVQQFFISGEKLSADYYNSFTIRVDKSNLINCKNPLSMANYIIKFSNYYNGNHQDFPTEKEMQFNINRKKIEDKINYNFTINLGKNYENIKNIRYEYFFTIIPKKFLLDSELLNTTAIVLSTQYYEPWLYTFETSELNKSYSFSTDLESSQDYLMQIFIKINVSNEEESYYSTCKDLTEPKKKDELEKKNKILTNIIIAIGSVLLAILLLFIFVVIKYKRKSKNLKSKVEAISFSSGIEDDSLDKACNNDTKAKKDEDYDNTFI